MPKPVNIKCLECSKLNWRKKENINADISCYVASLCSKKRSYYRRINYYRSKLRSYHRYLKFLGNKCIVCGSISKLEAHHIKSQVRGGEDIKQNIVTLCSACHKVITIYNRRIGKERKLIQ